MFRKLTDRLNHLTGPLALLGFFLLLFEQTELMRAHPVLVQQINLSILGLFALDVLLNWLSSSTGLRYLKRNWFDLIIFVPLIPFIFNPAGQTVSVIASQTAILAMLLARMRRVHKFVMLLSLKPAQLMLISFAGIIGFGTALLMQPVATMTGKHTDLIGAPCKANQKIRAGDRAQKNNLAAAHPDRVAELSALLKTIREQGHSAPRLLSPATTMKASNPFVRHMFTADPSARVIDDRLYVYTSHDQDDATGYDMVDWWLFSTDDMVTWKDHGAVFKLKDFAWAEKYAWAPEAVAANGKHYLFLPTDRSKIGVAVSDNPDGPFVDAIGAPLIDNATMPEAGTEPIDPAILVDDDGTTWLYFGCRQPMVAKLDPSLTKLAGPLQKLVILTPSGEPVPQALPGKNPQLPAGYGEGPSLFKRDGRYYLVYSNGWAHDTTLVYATSDSPTGPFTYQGRVMHPVDCSTHHGMVGEFRGKWYVFYHTAEVSGGNGYRRSVCVDELTFDADGKIIPVTATSSMK